MNKNSGFWMLEMDIAHWSQSPKPAGNGHTAGCTCLSFAPCWSRGDSSEEASTGRANGIADVFTRCVCPNMVLLPPAMIILLMFMLFVSLDFLFDNLLVDPLANQITLYWPYMTLSFVEAFVIQFVLDLLAVLPTQLRTKPARQQRRRTAYWATILSTFGANKSEWRCC